MYAVFWTVASNIHDEAPETAAVNLPCYTRRQTKLTRAASGAQPALSRGHAPTANAGVLVVTTK